MRTMPCLLPLVVALAQLAAREAQACAASSLGLVSKRNVIPPDGTAGVPTNARVIVSYAGLIGDHPKLQTSAGEPIAVGVSSLVSGTYVITPAAPLAANTTYQVLSDYGQVPCTFTQSSNAAVPLCSVGSADGGGAASFAISSFTTTTWSDAQSPGDFAANSVGVAAASCYSSACCGPYTGFLATLGWSRADDAGGMVYYEVSARGSLLAAPVLGTSVTGFLPCGGSTGAPPEASFTGTPGEYTVVAVDLAGNRSQPHVMTAGINCNVYDGGLALPVADAAEWASDVPAARADVEASVTDAAVADGVASEGGTVLGGAPGGGKDAGVAPNPDAAAVADGGGAGRDAAKPHDAVYDDRTGARATDGDSGCSCRVAGPPQGMLAWVLGGLALALAARRRRR